MTQLKLTREQVKGEVIPFRTREYLNLLEADWLVMFAALAEAPCQKPHQTDKWNERIG